MLLISKENYEQTLAILRKKATLAPIFQKLKTFIEDKYDVKVANFIVDKIRAHEKRKRLKVLILQGDIKKVFDDKTGNYDEEKQKIIADKFRELSTEYKFATPEELEGLFVAYTDFTLVFVEELTEKHAKEAEQLIKRKYKNLAIWEIEQCVFVLYVFFETDDNLKKYKEEGVLEDIKNNYLSFIKQYDEFDMVKQYEDNMIYFGSKETIDREHGGSTWRFYKSL